MNNDMKIMRYRQRIVGDFTPDPEMGPWCRYKEVEPLLERIKELETKLSKAVENCAAVSEMMSEEALTPAAKEHALMIAEAILERHCDCADWEDEERKIPE